MARVRSFFLCFLTDNNNQLNCLFPTYFSNNRNTDWHGSSAALAVRCTAQFSIGRHSVGGRSDRIIFVQHIHCDRWSFYNAKRYHFSTYYGIGVNRADSVPNNVHFGCEPKKCRNGRSHETETGPRGSINVLHCDLQTIDAFSFYSLDCYVLIGGESRDVGDINVGKISCREVRRIFTLSKFSIFNARTVCSNLVIQFNSISMGCGRGQSSHTFQCRWRFSIDSIAPYACAKSGSEHTK